MRLDRVKVITAMARANINGNELAVRSGLSRMTVTAVKSGKSCSLSTAEKLAEGLGVSLSNLLEESPREGGVA